MSEIFKQAAPQLDANDFLRDYWQQKPLLIRNALENFKSPLSPDELAGLSLEEEIESRLVIAESKPQPWKLQQGPFTQSTFTSLPKKGWTLLVQAVDLWVPEVRDLLGHFDFLPRWRVDDVMVSYAVEGGSVGPHFDYYDVFLIQGQGQRRWQIGGLCNERSPLLEGVDLKILRHFESRQEWVTNPGDILYLPPRIAHYGVAQDDQCITYSVGFRSPTAGEMLADLATELMSHARQQHYVDPPLTPQMADAALSDDFIRQVKRLLKNALDDEAVLRDWFARYMTAPKYPELHAPVELAADELKAKIEDGSISALSPNSRYLKSGCDDFYLDGEKL